MATKKTSAKTTKTTKKAVKSVEKKSKFVRDRKSFGKIPPVMDIPNLIGLQTESFDWFVEEGVGSVLHELSPFKSANGQLSLSFGDYRFEDNNMSTDECKDCDETYAISMYCKILFTNNTTGETKEQEVFMGDFPKMTRSGTFIINGTERVVVSQLVRSPGVFFSQSEDKSTHKTLYGCKLIPDHGA